MDDAWSWLATLPEPSQWPSTPPSLALASADSKSICLAADRTAGSDAEALLTFSITFYGFHTSSPSLTLWLSDPVSPSTPHIPLLLQLLRESVSISPSSFSLSSMKLDQEAVSGALGEDEQARAFLSLALLLRLFWLCATEAPADAGFLFFRALDAPLEQALGCQLALRGVLLALGPDVEESFMRSVGYMLCKWCILRELQGSGSSRLLPPGCCPSYAAERHGLWVLRGFAPVPAMARVGVTGSTGGPKLEAKDSVLRYALAHQQLEAVVQLEYNVCMRDPRFIRVSVRVDNIRLHVVRLRFGRRKDGEDREEAGDDEDDVVGERHFPSRARVWVGPELGSSYATGPSLGRSSGNPEREVEAMRTVKGRFGGGKTAGVKAAARTATRARARSWRWEQEAEGGAGVFEGVLHDGATGTEVAAWRPVVGAGGGGGGGDPRGGMRRRYSGWGRAFSKAGGVVVAGDEVPEAVEWRVGREMEGRVVRWRIAGRVWVSYFANDVKTGYFETRSVEWREDVDLALIAGTNELPVIT
ncbi:unnamed protein product [Musa acuminata subsp. malaccensis]|uniref:(wild Malaysian banana) hypothetical protein n=1 Tax=Musa acuminata subsp. malaccensis TaxID=214687 RepID=A0A804K0P3_MUSAM|nr:PREDICTED: uncharacterized protein LOC103992902 [Musa acuminata subsp. malaccensis]CAG1857977.1 unnamed protein product [Musa acuminata subsp. malaccensis]